MIINRVYQLLLIKLHFIVMCWGINTLKIEQN